MNERRSEIGRRIGFWLGLALFFGILLLPTPVSMRKAARAQLASGISAQAGASVEAQSRAVEARARTMLRAAAVTALVACWWMFVAIPIPATSLIPLFALPLVGVLPIQDVAARYGDHNIFLFMGGFIIALGVQRWGLHRRIALHVVRLVGTGRRTIILGFMVATALLSMWISNTATTMMMLPISLAVIDALGSLDGERGARPAERAHFAAALMLGIAYAASIGGVATPIGTPPNIVLHGQIAQMPGITEISFATWVLMFAPLALVFVPITWLVLTRLVCPVRGGGMRSGGEVIRSELRGLGPLRREETLMALVGGVTALLWMTRSLPIGEVNYGWPALIERLAGGGWFRAAFVKDATVAVGMAVFMFLLPATPDADGRSRRLMDWDTAQKLPWGILLLFGGGFAIAKGFEASGLSYWCGVVFADFGVTSPLAMIAGTCGLMTFLTEITSNTATTQIMLPILGNAGAAVGVHPLLVMLPATLSASCAFMLPVATPPNAIVFGSGKVGMGTMVRAGLVLNVVGIALVTGVIYLLAVPLLGLRG